MTDFLEDLLKQPEEDDEEPVLLPLSHRATQIAHPHTEASGDRFPDGDVSAVSTSMLLTGQRFPVDLQAEGASWRTADNRISTTENTTKAFLPPAQSLWDRVRRTYSAAHLWQVRTVRHTGSTFAAAGQANKAPYSLTRQETVIPGYAALVDAAFARDARRYDGPLRIL